MKPRVTKENRAGESRRNPEGGSENHGLATTLKTPGLPDPGVGAEWMTPPNSSELDSANAECERNVFDASLRALNRRQARDDTRPELRMVDFSVEAPGAKCVQLAADFTDWNNSPINMIQFEDGYWTTTVPLPSGVYAYGFLVDGQWYDDPIAARGDGKSRGPGKAYIQIK
jgi:hypothetical protein